MLELQEFCVRYSPGQDSLRVNALTLYGADQTLAQSPELYMAPRALCKECYLTKEPGVHPTNIPRIPDFPQIS